jgi:hypothetical protein
VTPRLAPALERLLREVNTAWPGRSRTSDGWLGDAAHRARTSDHNPNEDGLVLALDLTSSGINMQQLLVDATHHPACWYVIHRGLLYSRTHHFTAVPYYGANAHMDHVHVNLRHEDWAVRSRRSWLSPTP